VIAIDLFAGLGGFTEGAEQAGVKVVWTANHWSDAVEAHKRNHPDAHHVCQDLQQADRLTTDLRTRNTLEKGLANLIWHTCIGQLAFGFTQRADFRNRVNACRHVIDKAPAVVADNIARR